MNENCNVVKDLLPLYEDGVCTNESKELVETHLETCEECRNELKKMKECPEIEAKDVDTGKAIKKAKKKIGKQKKKAVIRAVAISLVLCIFVGFFAAGEELRSFYRKTYRDNYFEIKMNTRDLDEANGGKYLNITSAENGNIKAGDMKFALPKKYSDVVFIKKSENDGNKVYTWQSAEFEKNGTGKAVIVCEAENPDVDVISPDSINPSPAEKVILKILNKGANEQGFDSAFSREFINYIWSIDSVKHCGAFASPKDKLWEFTYYASYCYSVPCFSDCYYMFDCKNDDYSAIGSLYYTIDETYSNFTKRAFYEITNYKTGKVYTVLLSGFSDKEIERILSSISFK